MLYGGGSEKWSWPSFLEKVHILYNVRIFQDKISTIIQKYWNLKKKNKKKKTPNEISNWGLSSVKFAWILSRDPGFLLHFKGSLG